MVLVQTSLPSTCIGDQYSVVQIDIVHVASFQQHIYRLEISILGLTIAVMEKPLHTTHEYINRRDVQRFL